MSQEGQPRFFFFFFEGKGNPGWTVGWVGPKIQIDPTEFGRHAYLLAPKEMNDFRPKFDFSSQNTKPCVWVVIFLARATWSEDASSSSCALLRTTTLARWATGDQHPLRQHRSIGQQITSSKLLILPNPAAKGIHM
jgi:hypothetical protein